MSSEKWNEYKIIIVNQVNCRRIQLNFIAAFFFLLVRVVGVCVSGFLNLMQDKSVWNETLTLDNAGSRYKWININSSYTIDIFTADDELRWIIPIVINSNKMREMFERVLYTFIGVIRRHVYIVSIQFSVYSRRFYTHTDVFWFI